MSDWPFKVQPPQELRRPGIDAICAELKRAHPDWSDDHVISCAKVEWHRRNPRPTEASHG